MSRIALLLSSLAVALAACGPPTAATGPGGVRIYRITARDAQAIPARTLDSVNSLRQAAGVAPLQLSQPLTSAASIHSRDMARQNRPWHFGSDGSSPLDRVRRAGYGGAFLGETISESYETELQTLAAWMEVPDQRAVILDPLAREMGIAWHQEPSGKIWWTLVTGTPAAAPVVAAASPSPVF